jgi:predicted nucleic acid-binding protein
MSDPDTPPLLLADKSALVRGVEQHAAENELCVCAITRLEMLYSARDRGEYVQLEEQLDTFRQLRMDAETFAVAQGAQRELAGRSQHRVPIPDLLIGACAHQHSAGVLHADRHYDLLAEVLTIESVKL